nr:oligosaccharide flippase family protein [Thermosipho sp. 1223]
MWYTITDFLLKGMGFITIPIFTRLLSVEEYGIVSVYMTFAGIFMIITGLDIHASIGTGINDFKEQKKEFLSSVLFLSLISFIVQFIFIFLFRTYFSNLFNIYENLIILAVISGYLGFIFTFYNTKNVFEKKYKKKSLLSLTNALLNVSFSILLVLFLKNNRYLGRIYGDLLSKILLSSILFLIIILKGKKLIWLKAWRYSLVIGIPLILHNLSGIILSQFDRLAIQKIVNSEKVGLYSYSYNLGMIPLVILGATNLAWVPWFYDRMYKNKKVEILKKIPYYNGLYVILLLLIFMLVPELGLIMAPKQYYASLIILPIITTSYYMQFLYTIYVNFAFFYKKTGSISIGTFLAGLINIILNIWLIPIFGYEVAALTTLISYFFLLLFHALNVKYHLKDNTISARYMFSWAFLMIALSLIQYYISKRFGMFSLTERISRIVIFGSFGIIVITRLYKRLKHYLK